MTEPRLVTLPTVDHGDVTVPEPAWCAGHADYRPGCRADISHDSPKVLLTHGGLVLGDALISQAPCAERGTREVQAFVVLDAGGIGGLAPAELYDLAASLDSSADRLRDLADRLTAVIAEDTE